MRLVGTVKFFNHAKGYGFIAPEDGSRDIFVHITTVHRAGLPYLEEGFRLSFETESSDDGRRPQAVELQLL